MQRYRKRIDISRHQDDIDFERLVNESGVEEVVARCTMGATGKDDRFKEYWFESRFYEERIDRGVYHYPSLDPWVRQYDNIMFATRGEFGQLGVTIDNERTARQKAEIAVWPKSHYTDLIYNLSSKLKQTDGARVTQYSNYWEWVAMTTQPAWAGEYDLWLAGYPYLGFTTWEQCLSLYQANRYHLRVPRPWATWDVWQCASTGRLPGIAGNVDLNLVLVSEPGEGGGSVGDPTSLATDLRALAESILARLP